MPPKRIVKKNNIKKEDSDNEWVDKPSTSRGAGRGKKVVKGKTEAKVSVAELKREIARLKKENKLKNKPEDIFDKKLVEVKTKSDIDKALSVFGRKSGVDDEILTGNITEFTLTTFDQLLKSIIGKVFKGQVLMKSVKFPYKAGNCYCIVNIKDTEGQIVTITLWDADLERLYDHLKVNQIYFFFNFVMRSLSKEYDLGNRMYDLTAIGNSFLVKSEIDDLKQLDVKLIKIRSILTDASISECSVLGIVKSCSEIILCNGKSGPVKKRDVVIYDDEEIINLRITAFAEKAMEMKCQRGDVILVTHCRRVLFNDNVTLNPCNNSYFTKNCKLDAALSLKKSIAEKK